MKRNNGIRGIFKRGLLEGMVDAFELFLVFEKYGKLLKGKELMDIVIEPLKKKKNVLISN